MVTRVGASGAAHAHTSGADGGTRGAGDTRRATRAGRRSLRTANALRMIRSGNRAGGARKARDLAGQWLCEASSTRRTRLPSVGPNSSRATCGQWLGIREYSNNSTHSSALSGSNRHSDENASQEKPAVAFHHPVRHTITREIILQKGMSRGRRGRKEQLTTW